MHPLPEEGVPQEEEDDNRNDNEEGDHDHEDVTNKNKSTTRKVEVMPKNYLRFVYTYSIHCLDKRKVEAWMSDKIEQGRPQRLGRLGAKVRTQGQEGSVSQEEFG